jgi:hypothetical protein
LNGPYKYTFETREVKAKKQEELLKTRTKKTKAVRKKLEAANVIPKPKFGKTPDSIDSLEEYARDDSKLQDFTA